MSSQKRILRLIEPLIYAKPMISMIVLLLMTVGLGVLASQTRIDAGYLKSIPLEHPYMDAFMDYREDLGGANIILVALMQEEGTIYNEDFLGKLKKVTDEVFFLPGVNRARVQSIFTPNVRYIEVVEGGLSGGNVVPASYEPTDEMFDLVQTNVGKADVIGRLVSEDERGALVQAQLLDIDPKTGEELDYVEVAHRLEQIRQEYETEGIKVHVIGFAKVVGDIVDASLQVFIFFAVTLVMTALLLWGYLGSSKLAAIVLVASVICVVWEFGLLTLAGYGLDPFAILVPFLVLAVSVSHGVQYVNAWVHEMADAGRTNFDASLITFRRLFIPGSTALITDLAGFLTILLIPIDIIQEMALNAAFGMFAIIITNKVMVPIWLTWVNIRNPQSFKDKQIRRDRLYDGLWRTISYTTRPGVAVPILLACGVLLGWSVWKHDQLQIGSFSEGVPELRPDSRYNQDNAAIVNNFSIGTDQLKVMAETDPEACIKYDVMEEIDRFAWRMQNTAGVQSTVSLGQIAKQVNMGFNEGWLKFKILPRNRYVLSQAITPIPSSTGLLLPDCSVMPVIIFTADHKAETIENIVAAVKKFRDEDENRDTGVKFTLASGNVGVMAATNEVIKDKEIEVLLWVYLVIVILMLLAFRSLAALICIVAPLSLVSLMGYGVMTLAGIGLKVATLPILALAVGIGVDYGVYVYSVFQEGVRDFGLSLQDAYYRTMQKTGKAVVFTGIALGAGVATWLFSDLQFQIDMGILLLFIFTANMIGAILVLPALAYFFMDYPKPEGGYTRLEDIDESQSSAH
ncbi:MMPL family transporter [Salinisphaera sp. P385]|uniref:MMPL family transporter n=1 Tax=Spectribacter acetivorans TaxID=3075603 RepID=A0ABU3B5S3_9GAMM|nr:MMPL family transporter [Salinisphaera sp. P385]MDT0617579.1 MMPL family transporter [Salinisphaera sp. P385]